MAVSHVCPAAHFDQTLQKFTKLATYNCFWERTVIAIHSYWYNHRAGTRVIRVMVPARSELDMYPELHLLRRASAHALRCAHAQMFCMTFFSPHLYLY